MTYTRDDVIRVLGYYFNGGRYGDITDPPPGMPKAKANPSHQGVSVAEIIDIGRVIGPACKDYGRFGMVVLWLLHGCEYTLAEASRCLGENRYEIERIGFAEVSNMLRLLGTDADDTPVPTPPRVQT